MSTCTNNINYFHKEGGITKKIQGHKMTKLSGNNPIGSLNVKGLIKDFNIVVFHKDHKWQKYYTVMKIRTISME